MGTCRLTDGKAVHDDLVATCPDALAAFTRPRTTLFGGAAGYLGSVFTDVVTDVRPTEPAELDDAGPPTRRGGLKGSSWTTEVQTMSAPVRPPRVGASSRWRSRTRKQQSVALDVIGSFLASVGFVFFGAALGLSDDVSGVRMGVVIVSMVAVVGGTALSAVGRYRAIDA